MYGMIDDLQDLQEQLRVQKEKTNDLKVLVNLLLADPNNKTAQEAVKIAMKQLE